MANSAPYEVNVTASDDETFAFSIPFEKADGTAFDFDDWVVEYSVAGRGPRMLLTIGDGITIGDSVVAFQASRGRLQPGIYDHGCRIKQISSGFEIQVFDGTVTITEGAFR